MKRHLPSRSIDAQYGVRDLGRSIDYLESRTDIDRGSLFSSAATIKMH